MIEKDNMTKKAINKKALIAIIAGTVAVVAILLVVLFKNDVSEYSITFDSNGGSSVETLVIEENGKITKPEDPTKEGYVFVGWYLGDELYDFNKPVTKDMKLEARWELSTDVTGVKLNETKLTLKVGEKATLVAKVSPENAKNKSLTWKSSDSSVVSVDEKGNIKALKAGSATITVTTKDGGFKATAAVTVKEEEKKQEETDKKVKVTGVTLNKSTLSLEVNESSKLTATIKPSNATNKNVTWKSSDTNVATVDGSGNVKAVGAGTATITVTTKDGSFTAKATVTVTKKEEPKEPEEPKEDPVEPEEPKEEIVKVTGVELDKSSLTLTEGDSSKLTATVKPSNAKDKGITWTSSNTSVATVDENGNVKAIGAGTATITVTTKDGSFTAKATVTVNKKPDSYTITFTEIKQEVTGLVLQYSMDITKNGSAISSFKGVRYNGKVVKQTLAGEDCNKSVTSAVIVLSDGSEVTANVVYR